MEISRKYIESLGGFSGELPSTINLMLNVIPSNVPRRLALAIVLSELTTFISSFRNNIQLNTDSTKHKTYVPTNLFLMGLAPSGVSKDRTRGLIKDLMKGGYEVLDKYLKDEAIRKAKGVSVMETGNETTTQGKELFFPIRTAIYGCPKGPDLPLLFSILGKKEILKRISKLIIS